MTKLAKRVTFTADMFSVYLMDGRIVSLPLACYPRLLHAKTAERRNYRLIAKGRGIHWDNLEEDISVASILAGKPSGESTTSLRKWIFSRVMKRRSR